MAASADPERHRGGPAMWPAVALGAMAGASLRYGVACWWNGDDRVTVIAVNVVGSFVLGVLTALVSSGRVGAAPRAFVGPGLCAAMTTFSTLAVETVDLQRYSSTAAAAAYLGVSVVSGLAGAKAGLLAGRAVAA